MNNLFKGIDWATYAKSRTQEDHIRSLADEASSQSILIDEESDSDEEKPAEVSSNQDNSGENKSENIEEKQKKEAEQRQKIKIAK